MAQLIDGKRISAEIRAELKQETKAFIEDIQTETGVPVTIISTGPDLKDTIDLRKELL